MSNQQTVGQGRLVVVFGTNKARFTESLEKERYKKGLQHDKIRTQTEVRTGLREDICNVETAGGGSG